jgi:hypothetical protein
MQPLSIIAICFAMGFAGITYWLVWRDDVKVALGIIVLGALALRIVYPSLYPAGYNDDEPGNFQWAVAALASGRVVAALTGTTMHYMPGLFPVLFAAVPASWCPSLSAHVFIRGYSAVLGAASCVGAYAVVRALRGTIGAGLCTALLVAVLPWSLYYGRYSFGGDIICCAFLLLAMVARLIEATPEAWLDFMHAIVCMVVGIGMLTCCLFNYVAGLIAITFPLLGIVLARRWSARIACGGMLVGSAVLWLPYWNSNQLVVDVITTLRAALMGESVPSTPAIGHSLLASGFADNPVTTLLARTQLLFTCLVSPVAHWSIWTRAGVAMHPPGVLVAAVVALYVASVRTRTFLLGGFVCATVPALISNTFSISGHRMLYAFPFLAIAAGLSVDIFSARWRLPAAVLLAAYATQWSLRWFFSETFWAGGSSVFPYEVAPAP